MLKWFWGIEAYLSGQLASFSALTLMLCHLACKRRPEMTYKVSSWTSTSRAGFVVVIIAALLLLGETNCCQ